MTNLENRYIACMVLHAVGDTIGYNNSHWEFITQRANKSIQRKVKGDYYKIIEWMSLEKYFEFVDVGGVNSVPGKGWLVSDDTILHMATAEALLEKYTSMNSLGENTAKKYVSVYDQLFENSGRKRSPGLATLENIERLVKGTKWDSVPYRFEYGGSGASMRSLCIGLAFPGKENRQKLIQVAIETGRITHNSAIGYLGGLASALFTAFAIEDIPIKKWPILFMELFEDKTIYNYIKKAGRDVKDYIRDSHIFIGKWKRYIEDKFDSKGEPKKRRTDINLIHRTKYYHENFGNNFYQSEIFPGGAGDDSVIIAYDSLIDAGDSWEKLVVYSMLHAGDTDTTGCIASGFWGAVRGFEGTPDHILDHLEFRSRLEKLGKDLFKRASAQTQ